MESCLVDDFSVVLAIPSQPVSALLRPGLFENDADGVGEAHGIVRSVWGQEEHFALPDGDVSMFSIIHDLEKHGTAVLIEPFGSFVEVEIGAGIGTTDDLQEGEHIEY